MSKIIFDGRKQYIERTKGLSADVLDVFVTVSYTPGKKRIAKRIGHQIKTVIRSVLLNPGTFVNLSTECLYSARSMANRAVSAGH